MVKVLEAAIHSKVEASILGCNKFSKHKTRRKNCKRLSKVLYLNISNKPGSWNTLLVELYNRNKAFLRKTSLIKLQTKSSIYSTRDNPRYSQRETNRSSLSITSRKVKLSILQRRWLERKASVKKMIYKCCSSQGSHTLKKPQSRHFKVKLQSRFQVLTIQLFLMAVKMPN